MAGFVAGFVAGLRAERGEGEVGGDWKWLVWGLRLILRLLLRLLLRLPGRRRGSVGLRSSRRVQSEPGCFSKIWYG